MSSVSSAAQSGQQSQGMWSALAPYVAPPIAASAAIIPVFYGLMVKSAQQLGNPIPRMSIRTVLVEGCRASPTIGVIVGTQMGAQTISEKVLKVLMKGSGDASSFAPMLLSSLFVGVVSAPALAVFNGQTMPGLKGQTMSKIVVESLKSLSVKQTGAIVTRETSFLFSLRVSGPVGEYMKHSFGDNRCVEFVSTFATGAIGSLVGHPADTALTLWQKGMKVENFRQTMRGGPIKALAVGGFSICYRAAKELIESSSK